jgi:transcription-repair coupling factor (superfamily II helicase)
VKVKTAPRRKAPVHSRRAPAAKARRRARDLESAATLGGQALQLLALAEKAGASGLIHVASSERRAERLAGLLRGLAPKLNVLMLPPWDCLPYDHAPPSREAMGRRMGVLRQLAEAPEHAVLITTADALLQRVPPREICRDAAVSLRIGERFSAEALRQSLGGLGYVADERVDEPGEMAFHGQVADVFPAGAEAPVRIAHDGETVAAIERYDAATQLTADSLDAVTFDAASEAVRGEDDESAPSPGMEHWLAEFHKGLDTIFDYRPGATLVLEPGVAERCRSAQEQVADAYEARLSFRAEARREGARPPLAPERLYLTEAEWQTRIAEHPTIELRKPSGENAGVVPRFAMEVKPQRAFAAFLRRCLDDGRRVVLVGGDPQALKQLARRAEQAARETPIAADDWTSVVKAREGAILTLALDLDRGFVDQEANAVVIAATDLVGGGFAPARAGPVSPDAALMTAPEFRIGDVVIHLDYGLGLLAGLESIPAGDGALSEAVRLAFKDEDKLLVPVEEMHRIWRYGADSERVTLDRLDGDAWQKRRVRVEEEIAEAARGLIEQAKARTAAPGSKLSWPVRDYERFASRFPFAETPDQARAIAEVLADLASGRAMNRLVCGDVGYGKTEVALRAAAAAALAGKQVAILAPTTVLVRQHVQTFTRRFRGIGIEIAHLSRLVTPAEARRVRAGLADDSIRLVIGTHALLAKGVAFKDLGLVVIDEEQRFGTAHKRKIQDLARGLHLLTLTATPIPRTLQGALAGLVDLSLITTPPARRRPIRTFVRRFDSAMVRQALTREARRGGQSFLVCPRIEDIEPMAARLRALAPELELIVAHGKMPVEDVDESMVRFADGHGDVLLATNIIENGLDVPRANTMLVWRADRFGLAQLHQLRGRVGRGRVRGVTYLITDPEQKIAPATEKRLKMLETLDRLGAGFAISARDLDQRGAGDLLGDEQAGHVKLIGPALYRHLLDRAMRLARGDAQGDDWSPELNIAIAGRIPEAYVAEPEARINLYARLARAESAEAVAVLGEEIEDRFGEPPEEVARLLEVARLRQLCRAEGVARIDAGPKAIALAFRSGRAPVGIEIEPALHWRDGRLILDEPTESAGERLGRAIGLLERLSGGPYENDRIANPSRARAGRDRKPVRSEER